MPQCVAFDYVVVDCEKQFVSNVTPPGRSCIIGLPEKAGPLILRELLGTKKCTLTTEETYMAYDTIIITMTAFVLTVVFWVNLDYFVYRRLFCIPSFIYSQKSLQRQTAQVFYRPDVKCFKNIFIDHFSGPG